MNLSIVNKALTFGFLILGVALLITPFGTPLRIMTAFVTFSIVFYLETFLKKRNIKHLQIYLFFICLAFWFNVLGEFLFYYVGFTYYDKCLHLFTGALIFAVVQEYFRGDAKIRNDIVLFTTLGMLALWEIYEYSLFAIFDFPMIGVISNGVVVQSPIDDTMIDLVIGFMGSLIYLFFSKIARKD